MSIISTYEIDATAAQAAIQGVQASFQGYNQALGQLVAQTAAYNKVGGTSRQVLTFISDAGVKTVVAVKEIGGAYKVLTSQTGAATNAQRKLAEQLKTQADLADRIASNASGGGRTQGPLPTTTIPQVAPSKIGLTVTALGQLTEAQLRVAATAKGMGVAQVNALVSAIPAANQAAQGFKVLSDATDKFKNKLEQVGKIAFATLIYRGISLLQQGFSQGAKSALDYGHQIGLIQTISQDSGESFDTWNKSIRGVADELGRPVTEVATDAYDALSNQVIKSTKDFDLLRTSITLEQNTGSAPGTGLDTLSSIINGLGVSALEAENIADKLFVTIDKGKVRLEDLKGTIGRTTGLAQQAGASFDETAAALAVLTQSGLKADEATTLLNNVFSEIIKPNQELNSALKELGYSSGPAGVRAEQLGGILQTLGQKAQKTSNGLATFFPDIRGLRGASTLFTQVEQYKTAIDALGQSQGANKGAKGILDDNEAQRILKEGERIKNYFTVDFGVGIISSLAKVSDYFGGFSKVLEAITPIAITAGAALVGIFLVKGITLFGGALLSVANGIRGVAAAIGLADTAALAFGRTLKGVQASLGIFVAVATATYLAGTFFLDKLASAQAEAAKARFKPIDDKKDTLNSDNAKNASKRVADFNSATNAMSSSYERFIAQARKLNNDFAEDAKKKFGAASEALKNSFSVALNYLRKNVSELEAAEQKSLDNITKLQDTITKVKESAADRQGGYQVKAIKNAYEQQKQYIDNYNAEVAANGEQNFIQQYGPSLAVGGFQKIAQEKIDAARKSRDAFLKAGDVSGAEKSYDKVNTALEQYESNVESIGGQVDPFALGKVDAAYANEQIQKLLSAKKKLEEQNEKEYNQALKQRQIVENLSDNYHDIAKFQDTAFDKNGKISPEFDGDPQKALDAYDALQKKRQDLQSQIALPKNPIEAGRITGALLEANQQSATQRNSLSAQLAAAQSDATLSASAQARQALVESEKKGYAELTQVILDNNKKLAEGAANIQKLAGEISATLNNNGQTTYNFGSDLAGGLKQLLSNSDTLPDERAGQAQQTIKDIQALAAATDKDIPAIKAKLTELKGVLSPIVDHQIVNPKDVTTTISIGQALYDLTTGISNLKEVKSDLSDTAVTMLQFKNAITNIDTKTFSEVIDQIGNLNSAAEGLTEDAGGVNALAEAMNNAARAASSAAQAIRDLNAARSGGAGGIEGGADAAAADAGATEAFAAGGVVGSQGGFLSDFYSGKFAKGSDTIPTMLGRDEFVVRAAMSRKFYSQLVAINSNQTPNYRSEGGSGQGGNSTSHNYHISVGNGGGSAKDTAMNVVQAIKRAQRQGTVK
jgi:TP901 family phage tail tape measure protein